MANKREYQDNLGLTPDDYDNLKSEWEFEQGNYIFYAELPDFINTISNNGIGESCCSAHHDDCRGRNRVLAGNACLDDLASAHTIQVQGSGCVNSRVICKQRIHDTN